MAEQADVGSECCANDPEDDQENLSKNGVNSPPKEKVPQSTVKSAAEGVHKAKKTETSCGKMGNIQTKVTQYFPKQTTESIENADFSCDEDQDGGAENATRNATHETADNTRRTRASSRSVKAIEEQKSEGKPQTLVNKGKKLKGNSGISDGREGEHQQTKGKTHTSSTDAKNPVRGKPMGQGVRSDPQDPGSSTNNGQKASGNPHREGSTDNNGSAHRGIPEEIDTTPDATDSPLMHIPGENISDCDTDASHGDSQKTQTYSMEEVSKKRGRDSDNSEGSENMDQNNEMNDISSGEEGSWLRGKDKSKKGDSTKKQTRSRMIRKWSDADTEEYRSGYPGQRDNPNCNRNLLFYTNKLSSQPNGDYIDEIHKRWFGDYERLERHHGYIQWLFPIREKGMNFQSQVLQKFEIEAINNDRDARGRVLKSYKMMLDFYGMRLVDSHKGIIERNKNWQARFRHLNSSYHNYLRITRILKSLGEFDYEYLKRPFLEFVLNEAYREGTLSACRSSCVDYWINTLRNDDDREAVMEMAMRFVDEHGNKKTKSGFFRQ